MNGDFADKEEENNNFRVLSSWYWIANGVKSAVQAEQSDQKGHHYRTEYLTLERFVGVVADLQHQLVVLKGGGGEVTGY